jgi:hypothetical protein
MRAEGTRWRRGSAADLVAGTSPIPRARRPVHSSVVRALLALLALLPAPALACGQTTHVWVSMEAVRLLPDGPIADLVADPELYNILLNGTMFPDGGYAVSDDYGEMAHWEPLQQAYRAWIQEEYGGDFSSREAQQHVAFLLGLSSHGLSDEVFDSLFYERSRAYDPGNTNGGASLDTASDVLFARDVGGIPRPTSWAPFEVLAEVYRDRLGYDVSVDTLQSGHALLYTALAYTDWARTSEERLETFGGDYPWAAAHMDDPSMAGSPPRQAPIVVAYWQQIWERLHGDRTFDEPVIAMEPPPGSFDHPTDRTAVEARVQLTFGRGVDASTLGRVSVIEPDGAAFPAQIAHFYGDMSHAVLLRPQEDWAEDTEYTVVVEPGVVDYDGDASTTAFSGTFSTGPAPAADPPPSEPPATAACSAAPGSAFSPLMLLLAWRRRRC